MTARSYRRMRAERLRGYFDLQLRLASTIAEISDTPLATTVALYTNFHRRFGLGDIDTQLDQSAWRQYVSELSCRETHEQRVDWTQAFFIRAPDEQPPPNERLFGCFSCGPPNEEGFVHFHFGNRDCDGGVGPLSASKIASRERDLREMFSFTRKTFPSAKDVRGASWLYNLEAYRRLFPAAFGESRRLPKGRLRLNGSSSWGQFLDHRGSIKVELRDTFLTNLKNLDVERPWRAFPLPALFTQAPIDLFYEHYEVEQPKNDTVLARASAGRPI